MNFYLFWPPIVARLGARRSLSAAIVGAIAVTCWRAMDARLGLFQSVFGDNAGLLFRTDTRCDALLWGAAAGLAAPWLRQYISLLPRLSWLAIVLAALVIWIYAHLPLLASAFAIFFPVLVLSTTLRPAAHSSRWLDTAGFDGLDDTHTAYMCGRRCSFRSRKSHSAVGQVETRPLL